MFVKYVKWIITIYFRVKQIFEIEVKRWSELQGCYQVFAQGFKILLIEQFPLNKPRKDSHVKDKQYVAIHPLLSRLLPLSPHSSIHLPNYYPISKLSVFDSQINFDLEILLLLSMKKYQLWLQRKTYTQHLDNLLRIKLTASERKLGVKLALPQKQKNLSGYQSQLKLTNSGKGEEQSYNITARQLQNHKLRLVRSKQIVRENEEMVKRINRTKPFISSSRPIDCCSYKLKRVKERCNLQHSSSEKFRNYQQFAKFYHDEFDPTHRFQLLIHLRQLQLRMPHNSPEIMFELLAPHSIAKTHFISHQQLLGRSFRFSFAEKLPDVFRVRVHSFRGLDDTILGDFVMGRPEEGEEVEGEWGNCDMPGVLRGKVGYRRLGVKLGGIKGLK